MTDPLAVRLNEALDLLDKLVDPLLDIGVCRGRVMAWKLMMRGVCNEYLEQPDEN